MRACPNNITELLSHRGEERAGEEETVRGEWEGEKEIKGKEKMGKENRWV